MTSQIMVWVGLVIVGVILLSILGAVHRREKFAFVAGILLVMIGQTVGTGSGTVGGALGLVGILIALGSTVPLLRQSAIVG